MEWLLDLGYVGLFVGAFLAATIIPFSSDILLVGMLVAGGNVVITVIVATVGNWAGGMASYWMGYVGKWEWIEKWCKIKRETLERQKTRVDRYGSWLAFLSWLPIVGDVFAIALGFYKVNVRLVLVYMFFGKALRFVMWAMLWVWARDWIM